MNTPITPRILHDIPIHLKSYYPRFVQFIKDYYQHLETDENFLGALDSFIENSEANKNEYPYIDILLRELGWDYYERTKGDTLLLVNTLRDFFRNKGNINSLKYLFRMLFDEDVELFYPRRKLFMLSNSDYVGGNKVIFEPDRVATPSLSEGVARVINQINQTEFVVNEVVNTSKDQKFLLEITTDSSTGWRPNDRILFVSENDELSGTVRNVVSIESIERKGSGFKTGDILTTAAINSGKLVVSSLSPGSIHSVLIKEKGSGYKVGDKINVKKPNLTGGSGFFAKVKIINQNGGIERINVIDQGRNFYSMPDLEVISSKGKNAVIEPKSFDIGGVKTAEFIEPIWNSDINDVYTFSSKNGSGAQIKLTNQTCDYKIPSYLKNSNHILGINNIFHDSLYFQEYSYEIKSQVPYELFETVLKDHFHPAGLVSYFVYLLTFNIHVNLSLNNLSNIRVFWYFYNGMTTLQNMQFCKRKGRLNSFVLNDIQIHQVIEYDFETI